MAERPGWGKAGSRVAVGGNQLVAEEGNLLQWAVRMRQRQALYQLQEAERILALGSLELR